MEKHYHNVILAGDALCTLRTVPDCTVQTCITSPAYYGLRDYQVEGQIGLEETPQEYVQKLVEVFREVKRVLRKDGTLWLNLGDSFSSGKAGRTDYGTGDPTSTPGPQRNGLPHNSRPGPTILRKPPQGLGPKQLLGIPWRVAFALQEDGWILRSDVIWSKTNAMPESVTDRPTKSHEYLFLLAKGERYYYDHAAILEPLQGGYSSAEEYIKRTNKKPHYSAGNSDPKGGGYRGDGGMSRQTVQFNPAGRNKRSVWTIPTTPFSGAVLLADYVGTDGRPYKVSEDCPIHGQRRDIRIRQKVGYGEQQDHSERHIFDMSSHLVQEPEVECLSTPCLVSQDCVSESVHRQNLESTHDYRNGEHSHSVGLQTGHDTVHIPERDAYNSGSPDQPCSELAIDHNTQNYRMGLALETNLAYTSCVETVGCTADMSELPLWSGLDGCKNESNTLLDGLNGHPLEQKSSRIAGKSSAKSSSLAYVHGNTAKCTCQVVSIDHFATFPPKLIEPCILAGSRPGDIVLDCFMGSGTTALVALQHGRRYLGIELNPDYIELAERRIAICQPNIWTSQGVA